MANLDDPSTSSVTATPFSGFGMDFDGVNGVKTGELGFSRTDFEEIVPDSDDEEIERRKQLRNQLMMMGGGLTVLENQGFVEEHGIVADSEDDECNQVRRRAPSGHARLLTKRKSNVFAKKKLECLNGSPQPGASSQADALKFIDQFLKCSDLDLPAESKSKSSMKPQSPPNLCSKGLKTLAQKLNNRTPVVELSSYEWVDREPNEQGNLYEKSYVLFYRRRRKRCATIKPAIGTTKFINDYSCSALSNQEKNEEFTKLSNETNDVPQKGITLISGSEEVENVTRVIETCSGNIDNDSDVDTHSKLQDLGSGECVDDQYDDIFSTQMAAEVIETLSFQPPKNCPDHILSDSFQSVVSDYSKDFREMVADIGYSSLQYGCYSGLKQNGDRPKHDKRIAGESTWHKLTDHQNDGSLSPPFFRRSCRGLTEKSFDPKFSNSSSPTSWMSTGQTQNLTEKNTKDGTQVLVHTYKRKRSAMMSKENRNPNIKFDVSEVTHTIESGKEHIAKSLSNVIPSHLALNNLIIPKRKRSSRVSCSLRRLESLGNIDNVRSEADTEKVGKDSLPKRNTPAWVRFSRKKRTPAARNEQVNGKESCKAKVVSFVYNESKSLVGYNGKIAVVNDSTPASSNISLVPPTSILNSSCFEKLSSKTMPKPSLLRELHQLGFSGVPLDSSCKNLRRRKHVANVRVLLSQHLDSDTITQQKRILAQFGLSVATSASDATHFVTNKFSRTRNMLEAIALGIPVVNHLWLESCAETGCLVDEKRFILKDPKKEKGIGFSLSASLTKAAQHPLLKDRKVFITPNIKPDKGMLSSLVKMVQGKVVEITKNYPTPCDLIVLSCEEDYTFCMPLLEKGIPVYHSELLLDGIVTQRLNLRRHQLFRD